MEFQESPEQGIAAGRQVFQLAHRIAVNRTVAGVHYPVDSMAGAVLGCGIGEAVVALAGKTCARRFDFQVASQLKMDPAGVNNINEDFTLDKMQDIIAGSDGSAVAEQPDFITDHWQSAKQAWRRGGAGEPS